MANLKTTEKKSKAQSMGMHTEVLTGRTQQKFFNPDEAENFYYFGTYDVDFNKRTDLDAGTPALSHCIGDGGLGRVDHGRPNRVDPVTGQGGQCG